LFSVYESWPLVVAAVLMYVSLGNCVITRGRALYQRWRRHLPRNHQFIGEAGSLVFHLSFFVLLAGILYGKAAGFSAFVNVIEGQSVVEARPSYDQIEEGLSPTPPDSAGHAGQRHGQGHVVLGAQSRDQVEGLEDRAHPAQPVVGEHGVGDVLETESGCRHRALGRPVETTDEREQGRLSAAGRTDQRHEFAGRDPQTDAPQGYDRNIPHPVHPLHLLELEADRGAQQVRSLHRQRIVAHLAATVSRKGRHTRPALTGGRWRCRVGD